MQEAFVKVLEFGFRNMNLQIIEAYTNAFNLSSIKLLERNNFTKKISENTDAKEVIYLLNKNSFPEFL